MNASRTRLARPGWNREPPVTAVPRGRASLRLRCPHTRLRPHPRTPVARALTLISVHHIAVVDDEPEITALLGGYLTSNGFRVTTLHSGAALLALMRDDAPALVLLDLGLPGEDGLSIARQLRELGRCGLVIVSGRGDAIDKVVGLEVGADDYVTKPFELRELVARVRAVLRRIAPVAPEPATEPAPAPRTLLRFGGWRLDVAARSLHAPDGHEVPLTSGEFDLLRTLAEHAGHVLSRDFLLERTRGREAGPFDRTVDVQIGRLRRKLDDDAELPRFIKAVRGAGYVLVAPVTRD
ncbi:MAG TPA: response regulator transcription factor [Burkholderiaceae bacterium]|nr:response regulator transcription factor [Burkholderiaceae bacterium]